MTRSSVSMIDWATLGANERFECLLEYLTLFSTSFEDRCRIEVVRRGIQLQRKRTMIITQLPYQRGAVCSTASLP